MITLVKMVLGILGMVFMNFLTIISAMRVSDFGIEEDCVRLQQDDALSDEMWQL